MQNTKNNTPHKSASSSKLTCRIKKLITEISLDMHEREQIIAISLLGAIAGHNTFLLGPPGTAKSLISRRISCAFAENNYFEYLMNRFSTPEEVFGPVSIKALKEDKYIRKIENYLPTADFAFLDEIWKSSPAILNSLLTIINEHTFKNGAEKIKVPLKSLIAASNEVPAENQGLEALYDRFIIRILVPPICQEDNFNLLLNSKPSEENPKIEKNLLITHEELTKWREELHEVNLSEDALIIIKYIRQQLADKFDELNIYVSDRRWQKAAMLLKASAFFNGRSTINHSDVLLLKYCLWTTAENNADITEIVESAIKNCGFKTNLNLSELDQKKNNLDKEINKELYHSQDIYKTSKLGDKKAYFKVDVTFKRRVYTQSIKKEIFYISKSYFKTKDEFHPVDENGNEIEKINCCFDGQGSFVIKLNDYYNYNDEIFKPEILFHRGDKKDDVNERLIDSLRNAVKELQQQFQKELKNIQAKYTEYKANLNSPFVTDKETDIALSGIITQIEQLNLRINDCDRLESLCTTN